MTVEYDGIAFELAPGWEDSTEDVEGPDAPWTLTRPNGLGAFQFSVALYVSGPLPNPSTLDLMSMVKECGQSGGGITPFDERIDMMNAIRSAAASFQAGNVFTRIWYLSDGKSIVCVTYTCAWEDSRQELDDCESMVRSMRFA